MHAYDITTAEKLCRAEELDEVEVTEGGELEEPEATVGTVIGFGYLDDDRSKFSTGLPSDEDNETQW